MLAALCSNLNNKRKSVCVGVEDCNGMWQHTSGYVSE